MKAQIYRIVAGSVLLAGFAVACRKDPTASGVGAPAEVILDFSALRLAQGDSATIEAKIVDNRLTPLEGDITFASCDGSTATVVPNAAFDPRPPTSAQAIVHAVGANATCIVASAEGAKPDSVNVIVLPTSFAGTLSGTSIAFGDTLTISATSVLKFNPATVAVDFPGGGPGDIISSTADQIQVLVPLGSNGPLTIDGILVTYVPGLEVSLETGASVVQTGDVWGTGDTSYATAPSIAVPGAGGTSKVLTSFGPANGTNCAEFGPPPPFGSIGPCVIYKFTLAAPDSLEFTVDWDGTADLDMYACDATGLAGCFESGGSAAGSSHPEHLKSFEYAAGDHYLVVELFAGGAPQMIHITINQP